MARTISDKYAARAAARRKNKTATVVHPPRVKGANVPQTDAKSKRKKG